MSRHLLFILGVLVAGSAGCTSNARNAPDAGTAAAACHFKSGRPCALGQVCLGERGEECNFAACVSRDGGTPHLEGPAVGCHAVVVPPVAGGPFECDPRTLPNPSGLSPTPPREPCQLGGLLTIDGDGWGACVPVSQCKPIACDPAFGGDGCPSGYGCDATARTCTPQ